MEGKIRLTQYENRYNDVITIRRSRYLKEKDVRGSQSRIARWRCDNEEEGNRFWMEDKCCRICKKKVGTLKHKQNM